MWLFLLFPCLCIQELLFIRHVLCHDFFTLCFLEYHLCFFKRKLKVLWLWSVWESPLTNNLVDSPSIYILIAVFDTAEMYFVNKSSSNFKSQKAKDSHNCVLDHGLHSVLMQLCCGAKWNCSWQIKLFNCA